MRTPRIVGPRSRWVYFWMLLPILLGAVLLAGWGDYIQFRRPLVDKVTPLQEQLAEKDRQIASLEGERGRLSEQLVALKRANQIDQEAMREVREELRQKQSKYLDMEQELTLLRGIVGSSVKSKGIAVQGFRLEPIDESQHYRFKFTISKGLKSAGTAVGWVMLTLEGKENGQDQELSLKQLTGGKDEKLKMRFRHFQDVDGLIQVPQGFSPERVVVAVNPTNNRLSPVKKTFDWLVTE